MATYAHHSMSEASDRIRYAVPGSRSATDGILRALCDAIRVVHDVAPKMWAITLLDDVVRLNFGPVEVFLVYPGEAWFPVSAGGNGASSSVIRESAPHKSSYGDAERLRGPHRAIARAFGSHEPGFRVVVENIRARYKKDDYLNVAARHAHARGLLAYLEGRFRVELPRPTWDEQGNAPRESVPLFGEAVFTAMHAERVSGGTIEMPKLRWSRARLSLHQARAANTRMPILIGDAANSVTTLIAWALVVDIDVTDEATRVEYECAKPLIGRSATELVKLSDGSRLDENYRRAYVPCLTPEFLHDAHDEPFRAETRDIVSVEGRRRLVEHFRIERRREVVEAAKAEWRLADPLLRCEVCGFSAEVAYGTPYIEAHHRRPLAELAGVPTETSVKDLACVCANCHRALHRDPLATIDTLAARVRGKSANE